MDGRLPIVVGWQRCAHATVRSLRNRHDRRACSSSFDSLSRNLCFVTYTCTLSSFRMSMSRTVDHCRRPSPRSWVVLLFPVALAPSTGQKHTPISHGLDPKNGSLVSRVSGGTQATTKPPIARVVINMTHYLGSGVVRCIYITLNYFNFLPGGHDVSIAAE